MTIAESPTTAARISKRRFPEVLLSVATVEGAFVDNALGLGVSSTRAISVSVKFIGLIPFLTRSLPLFQHHENRKYEHSVKKLGDCREFDSRDFPSRSKSAT